jgi:hypothetical protein
MELTDYSIEDLELLRDAVVNHKRDSISAVRYNAMLQFEVDIEQAIKDIQFEQERKDNLPIEP